MNRYNHVMTNNTNIVLKAVLFSLYHIGKIYGPSLDNLAKGYVELKKERKTNHQKNDYHQVEYRQKQKEIMNEAAKIISPLEIIMREELETKKIMQKPNVEIFNNSTMKHLEECLKTLLQEITKQEIILYEPTTKMEVTPFLSKEQFILETLERGNALIKKEQENRLKVFAKKTKTIENPYKNKMSTKGLISLCMTLALYIFLNIGGTKEYAQELGINIAEEIKEDVNAILENIEQFFTAEELQTPVLDGYKIQFEKIINNKDLTPNIKIDEIIKLNATDYKTTFDTILEMPDLSYEYKIDKIIHSNRANIQAIYQYLIENEKVPQETKVNAILHSDITNYQMNFQYILKHSGLKQYECIEYIAHSKYSYEEKFSFITNYKDFTPEQKIRYSLLLKDAPFATIFEDLVTLEEVTVEQVIENTVASDLYSFKTIMDALVKCSRVSEEQFVNTLTSYTSDFHPVTLEEKIEYVLETNVLQENKKIDIFWNLLSSYTLTEKEQFIFDFYQITNYNDFINLYKIKPSKLTIDQQRLLMVHEKVNLEKEEFVIEHYEMESKNELYDVIGGVAAEANWTYEDMHSVSNVFFNRISDPNYYSKIGKNPYLQFIEPHQFSVYFYKNYLDYVNPKSEAHAQKFMIAREAFLNMFSDPYREEEGVFVNLKHNYLEFRSPTEENFKGVQVSRNGNVYGVPMKSARIIYDDLFERRDLLSEKDKEILEKGLIRTIKSEK